MLPGHFKGTGCFDSAEDFSELSHFIFATFFVDILGEKSFERNRKRGESSFNQSSCKKIKPVYNT